MRILGDLSTLRIESKITPGVETENVNIASKKKLKYLLVKSKKPLEPNSTFVDYVVLMKYS
jgi:hypothetical protein